MERRFSRVCNAACLATSFLYLVCACSPATANSGAGLVSDCSKAKPKQDETAGDTLFRAGNFDEAEKAYAELAKKDSKNYRATMQLGQLALLANRFDQARTWLEKAIQIDPAQKKAKHLLAEVFYRQDDFARAAPLLRSVGDDAFAKQLESFRDVKPYEIHRQPKSISLKFITTDPLPLVRVRVNGREEATFLIDTGAAEVVLDKDFAEEVGAKRFGSATGTYAGGKQAEFHFGRIDSLTLGELVIHNLPIHIGNTRQFAPIFKGRKVDGILGTVLFYHFLATLDYLGGELILRQNTKENRDQLVARAVEDKSVVIPFWMAGDHEMVAWAKVDTAKPVLLLVDTGLAGGGVTLVKSVMDEAGIKPSGPGGEGIGGGGKIKVIPIRVKEVSLGEAKEQNVRGFFSQKGNLENRMGFRIGGVISHGFFRPYALTFDFTGMKLVLTRR